MEAIECILTRQSIRKFKPEPVPKEIIMNIIRAAQRSPSYKNSQPWEVAVVSGRKKEQLTEMLIKLLEAGTPPEPDIEEPKSWPPEIEKRISEHIRRRAETLGIDLSDPELKKKSKIANFRFYGAPHGIFLYQDSSLTPWSIFDMGLFAQSLMLAANALGVATVPQAFLIDYSKEIKEFLGIGQAKRLILGISIGYPDLQDRANSYRSLRESTENIVRWIE